MQTPDKPPEQRPPGREPGLAVGVAAGFLLSAVWTWGAWDVALALSLVFIGLTVAVTLGAPGWRPFALAMLAAAGLVGCAFVFIEV